MKYQFDSQRGVHSFYKEIDEDGDYTFFCKANLQLKNKVEVVYFEGRKPSCKTKSVLVDYSEVQGLIKSEFVIQIITNEEDAHNITISASEVWVRSFNKKKSEKIFDKLFNKSFKLL